MSVWKYLFDSEWQQRADIESLKSRQNMATRFQMHKSADLSRRMAEAEKNIGELALYCRTVMTLLIDKGLVTPEEFAQKLKQIDLSDGTEDGQ